MIMYGIGSALALLHVPVAVVGGAVGAVAGPRRPPEADLAPAAGVGEPLVALCRAAIFGDQFQGLAGVPDWAASTGSVGSFWPWAPVIRRGRVAGVVTVG